jgi:hypothetical protein
VTFAQGTAQSPITEKQSVSSAPTDTQDKNIQEYIELLRTDVRQQKAEIMGAVMTLNVDQSAKFWPIYSEYDAELTKLNRMSGRITIESGSLVGSIKFNPADAVPKSGSWKLEVPLLLAVISGWLVGATSLLKLRGPTRDGLGL